MAILWSCGIALAFSAFSAFASPRRDLPFAATAVATWVNFGTALDDGTTS